MQAELAAPSVVRGLLTRWEFFLFRRSVLEAYRRLDRVVESGSASPALREAYRWGGLPLVWLQEAAPLLFRLGVLPVVKKIEGRYAGAQLINDCSVFRRILPNKSNYIFWHTDADGTGSHSFDPMWNCWIPLETVGDERFPSLEVLVESEQVMRKLPPLHPGHRADSWVEEVLPGVIPFCPSLSRGDALIFGHYFLHRTQPMQQLAGPRIGAELRFTLRD